MLNLPIMFLRFWYFEAPRSLISFFTSLNRVALELFSLPLLVKTFFRPWKNEYRKGLIGFSRGMGIFIKTFVIIADLFVLGFLILLETIFFLTFLLWPAITFAMLVWN